MDGQRHEQCYVFECDFERDLEFSIEASEVTITGTMSASGIVDGTQSFDTEQEELDSKHQKKHCESGKAMSKTEYAPHFNHRGRACIKDHDPCRKYKRKAHSRSSLFSSGGRLSLLSQYNVERLGSTQGCSSRGCSSSTSTEIAKVDDEIESHAKRPMNDEGGVLLTVTLREQTVVGDRCEQTPPRVQPSLGSEIMSLQD